MLQFIKEYGKYVEITGYRDIEFEEAETFLKANRKLTRQNVDIQFFNAELIATEEHLYFAVLNALQAFKNKTNLSKSPAMETMLYVSAQRQIQKAIEQSGIKPKTRNMALIIIGDDPKQIESTLEALTKSLGSEPDESVLEITKLKETKIKKAFKITEEELKVEENGGQKKAIANLVIERVALLSTKQ
jgi:tRNA threonylcarbamoyladenosine modification (KEOPS) complex Cgi121 subunit